MNEEGQIDEGPPSQGPNQGVQQSEGPSSQGPNQGVQQSEGPPLQGPQQSRAGPQSRAPPREDFLKRLTNNDGLAKFLTVGFVLILVGMLLIHASPFLTNYGSDEPDRDDRLDDEAMANNLRYTGNLIRDIGIFFVGLFLALGGIHRDDLDTKYRMLMVSLAVLLILVAWFGFFTALPVATVGP